MYIELHTRSAFSFLEGASLPEGLIAQCAAYQMPAMALLDRDGVYGAPRFHTAAKRMGIRAHIGAEISIRPIEAAVKVPGGTKSHLSSLPIRYSLLAESRIGYQNLCRLITQYKLREKAKGEGRATLEELHPTPRGSSV